MINIYSLPHEACIDKLVKNNASLVGLYNEYDKWKDEVIYYSPKLDFDKVAVITTKYIICIDDIRAKYKISYKTNLLSSIMEELPIHIFGTTLNEILNKSENLTKSNLYIGPISCVRRIKFSYEDGYMAVGKDVDFAVAKLTTIGNAKVYELLIGLECKTYIDANMFADVDRMARDLIDHHSQIDKFYYGLFSELEARGDDVVKSSIVKGKEFILRRQKRPETSTKSKLNPISAEVLKKAYDDIKNFAKGI